MFAVAAVYFTKKYSKGFILGAVCIMFSLALYQSFLGFAIGLFVILSVRNVSEAENKDLVKTTLKYMACGVLGIVLYRISFEVSLFLYGAGAIDYKGIDTMGQIPLNMIPWLYLISTVTFFRFFAPLERFIYVSNTLFVLYIIVFLSIAFLGIRTVVEK